MGTYTEGPWVGFSDKGKPIAIMAAGRPGYICSFAELPSEADATLMIAAPDLLEALKQAQAFIGVMFGNGPDAALPETVTTPIGIPIKLHRIAAKIDAALSKAGFAS